MIITAIVLWVVALAFILVTLKNILVRAVKTRRCMATVSGVISDLKEKVSRRNGVISREYIPTVSYTVDGTEYSKRFTKAYHADTYKVGQTVEIMYNPDKPAEINKKGKSNKADIVILCIGVVIGVAGIVLLALQ
ncbi:MAG: hypothetical protein A4E71_02605 [Smithella sp. PtaU1.Bin162]|nr:MAG: hypothetical protein A4E71_02605 [Smithella sp. PtaU1.Bin162]